jgi:hypothetical protein
MVSTESKYSSDVGQKRKEEIVGTRAAFFPSNFLSDKTDEIEEKSEMQKKNLRRTSKVK